jgi:hypothetical protein
MALPSLVKLLTDRDELTMPLANTEHAPLPRYFLRPPTLMELPILRKFRKERELPRFRKSNTERPLRAFGPATVAALPTESGEVQVAASTTEQLTKCKPFFKQPATEMPLPNLA